LPNADFQNSCTDTLITPHLNRVATLPCEMFVLKKMPCSMTECSKLRCKTQPLKKVEEKYLLV